MGVLPQTDSKVSAEYKVPLASTSFIGLLVTQFLGAMNDNMYKWLGIYIAISVGDLDKEKALAIGSALFVLPYVILAAPAGFLADRFSKARVIRYTKFAEIIIMSLGVLGVALGNIYLMFLAVLLLGCQSALFGPAKLGTLPELLHEDTLSTANGIANLATMVAIIGGTLIGFVFYQATGPTGLVPPHFEATSVTPEINLSVPGLWISGTAMIVFAILGWGCSLWIKHIPPAAADRELSFRLFSETWRDLKTLSSDGVLLRVAFAQAFFWSLGCLVQLNTNVYANQHLGLPDTEAASIGLLMVVIALGVSIGSILAGVLSRGRVEMGMVPFAALGLCICGVLLFFSAGPTGGIGSYRFTALWLFLLGLTGGMYDVPLMAYLQQNSRPESRGAVFAASNFLTFAGMLVVSGLFYVMTEWIKLTPAQIFLIAGLATGGVGVYIFLLIPSAAMRFITWFLTLFLYRVRVYGKVNIPETGGVLLVSNHLTWADGVLLSIHCQRDVRLIAYDDNIRGRFLKWMAKIFRVIPINASSGPKALLRSLQTASQALKEGDVVVIFAEGAISRIGVLLPFQRGLLRIIEGTEATVIPVYLDELWGSVFSFSGGRFFWKVPKKWPYPITIMYGEPIQNPKSVFEVRQAVQELAVDAAEHRKPRMRALPRRFVRECRRKLWKLKVADSTNQELTGGSLLMRSLILRRLLGRTLGADEKMVGVYLPSSSGGVIVNAALALMRRVAVNLNYTMSSADLQAQIDLCGIKHVLTSRKFIEKIPLETTAQLIYLEDFAPQVTGLDKFIAATQAFALPAVVLEHWLGLHRIQPDDILTVIFTSGSTGEPKGVCLTHHNVASNIDAIDQLFDLSAKDMLLGVLPFFHSFGYTGTLWTVLSLKARGVYHYNPLDARVVGKMCEKYGVTITMTTPTFLRTYIKRCEKEQFAKIDLVVTGAERLPPDVADAFQQKFGVRPSEGYGTTELSPLASVNVPDHRGSNFVQQGSKPGTVGRPVPGVTAKVVDPDTNTELGPNEPGMLLIRGPNVMLGYLHRADRTAQVVRDGWYVTGDIARIDEDGFITITDRLSRFSKIGGEMVPHIKIEELLTKILAEPEDEGPELRAVVTAVSDDKKGERLVVIHKPLSKTIEQVCQELADAGLPNLWVPSPENFVAVDEIPVLGTGKLDLKGVKALAQERLGAHV